MAECLPGSDLGGNSRESLGKIVGHNAGTDDYDKGCQLVQGDERRRPGQRADPPDLG
ncbi:hypothetical protein GCM10023176_26590 [Micromonospora coerulea]|uniref:Uncharacterized protein n=1 Tax=Micromonospora coerulea TaxID=47856 RepID=A0ABP8SKX9_9ACTN